MWQASIASEVDGDDPLNAVLTDEARAQLESGGDEPVALSGIVCDVENGDYVQNGDFFEYAGRDSGTCNISFRYVGDGEGDYRRAFDPEFGMVFWEHVGAGNGDWRTGTLLAAPRTVQVADMSLGFEGGGWRLAADGAYSREDLNTFSSVDDGDNDGAAGKVALGWEGSGGKAFGAPVRIETGASWRGEESTFRSLGRTRDAYLGEVWNFTDTTRADESAGEVMGSVAVGKAWKLGGSAGVLDRPGLFRSTRREGNTQWKGPRSTRANYRIESVRRESAADSGGVGDLLRQRADVDGRVGWFRPGIGFWREDRENVSGGELDSGKDQVEVSGKVAFETGSALSGDIRVARRTTDVVDGQSWVRDSVGRTIVVTASRSRWGTR